MESVRGVAPRFAGSAAGRRAPANSAEALVYLSTLPVVEAGPDRLVVTRKFLEGLRAYRELWDGPVRCVVPVGRERTNNLDNVEVARTEPGIEFRLLRRGARAREHLAGASVVASTLGAEFSSLARDCDSRGIPIVYVSELALKTRMQIANSEESSSTRALRRSAWELLQEKRNRDAVELAAGIQCNGTPTYRAYAPLSRDPLLYFDSRTTADMTIGDDALRARLSRLGSRPLQLAFSGRLIPIKGAEDLIDFAAALRDLKCRFELRIFGGGSSEPAMRAAIERLGLQGHVRLEGTRDFASELMPELSREVDLFVCCHRQGDPSCTYLETFAAGVPIVGYGNEAFRGLLEHVQAGRAVPMGERRRLAELVASLERNTEMLTAWSLAAAAFAREHTFERTFERRVTHLRRVARSTR